jgi:heme A synthase
MKTLLYIVKNVIKFVFKIISILWEYFLNLNPYEKLIIFLMIPAMIINSQPIASYRIFGGTNYVFSPSAIYMIAIIIIILATYYIPAMYGSAIRIFSTLAYCISLIVMHAGAGIVKTKYSLTIWFFLNIGIALAFAALSLLSFVKYERDKQPEY